MDMFYVFTICIEYYFRPKHDKLGFNGL